jgi:HD-GYP domain-containing protein (c-di-GMP phosphodiesterase class II)
MDFDRYDSPDKQGLLVSAAERHTNRARSRSILIVESVAAIAFLACAVALALLATPARGVSIGPLLLLVIAYLIAAQVRFPVGSGWTAPTQLVFVPMLFVLPTPLVPLIVAVCSLADQLPRTLRGDASPTRVPPRIGDSWYSLGPALVLVLAHGQTLSWGRWPVLVLAFAAQVAFDAGAGLARSWFAERIPPTAQLPMLWLYVTDACLSCVAIVIAFQAVGHPEFVLMELPLVGLLWLFARERRERLDQTLLLSSAYRGTALLLGEVIEVDDRYTGIHSRQVVDLAIALADAIGLDSTGRRNVEFTALLHDVGKIHIPKEILNKPGALDKAEWEILRQHTIDGERMLRHVGGALANVGRFVRASHERHDGRGYPDRLAGDEIPIESRIVAVCDAYNAMTTDRPYHAAISGPEALAELRRAAGSQFDPLVVKAFEKLVSPLSRSATPMLPSPLWVRTPDQLRERQQAAVAPTVRPPGPIEFAAG